MHRQSLSSLATLLALAVIAPGCADRGAPEGPEQLDPRVLYGFESCDELLGYAKDNAKEMIEQYGNPWGYDEGIGFDAEVGGTGDPSGEGDSGGEGGGEPTDGGGDGAGGGNKDYSGTNVQELGVDEPDLIKTDGERVLALAQGRLHFVDTSGASPQKRGSIELGEGSEAQLFLHEDRALVLMRTYVWEDYGEGDGFGDDGGRPEGEFPEQPPQPSGLDIGAHFPEGTGSVARLVEVDLTDPDNLRIVSNLYIGGDLVNARLIDGVARVVLRAGPTGLGFKSPEEFMNWDAVEQDYPDGDEPGTSAGGTTPTSGSEGDTPVPVPGTSGSSSATTAVTTGDGEGQAQNEGVGFREGEPEDSFTKEWNKAKEAAKLYNLSVVESSKVEDWLPHYVFEDLSSGASKLSKGLLLDCADVRHPGTYSGLSTLSVLTVDLQQSLALGKGVGVFADGETIYASQQNLYVSTSPWRPEQWTEEDVGAGLESYVHKFSLASAEKAEYIASGAVRGHIRNQWSMSEHNGDLRLATTDQQSWDSETSESFVTVLRQSGDELQQIGQVGGLGKGEQIHGVRFIGDVGYVVTFRQTDPLYTIDLEDPSKPVALGELKIPGYSAYLHPVGEDLLLGVGQDGTEDGQLTGMQLSLFDVSDLKAPKRIHQAALGEAFGWSEALFDHKAFLYWGQSKLAVVPIESYTWDEQTNTDSSFAGALGYTVDAQAGILPVGQIEHELANESPDEYYYATPIRRSMVIGDQILTLSERGLKASLLGDLSDAAWIEF